MNTVEKILGGFVVLVGSLVVIAALLGYPLMWLWNWLMPILFKLPQITFWQAVGLNALSGILFKSSAPNSKKD